MVKFIEHEENQRILVYDKKTEEEYDLLKFNTVQQGIEDVKEFYENKMNSYEKDLGVWYSKKEYESRRKFLKQRDDKLKKLLRKCQIALMDNLHSNKALYEKLLHDLILQGLVMLTEPTVMIRIRRQDLKYLLKVRKQVLQSYEEITKKKIKLCIDKQNILPQECEGGVELVALRGGILIDNTLCLRVVHVWEKALPIIRELLFGTNENRAWYC